MLSGWGRVVERERERERSSSRCIESQPVFYEHLSCHTYRHPHLAVVHVPFSRSVRPPPNCLQCFGSWGRNNKKAHMGASRGCPRRVCSCAKENWPLLPFLPRMLTCLQHPAAGLHLSTLVRARCRRAAARASRRGAFSGRLAAQSHC